jgi:hypothetical protein
MLEKITSTISNGNTTLWMCPEVADTHINIKDVYLLAATNGIQKKKIEFSWKRGWYETAI